MSQSGAPLQLLLFVDKRPSSSERIRQIRSCIKRLATEGEYELQVVDVTEQPHLAEHFRLVATPSLVKIRPEPRELLAGSNLVDQIETGWSRWQRALETSAAPQKSLVSEDHPDHPDREIKSIAETAEVIRLADEIFRLQREKEELHAQLQFKDHLIAMLAHDLRNPLTAVSIALETLEMGHNPQAGIQLKPELTAQLLNHARTQTKALNRLITDILQSARDRSAEFRIQPTALHLGELCLEVIQRLQSQLDAKQQIILTDIPSDLPRVLADPEWVQQTILNLLDNAIKYTPAQGKIQISILHRTTQKVQFSICDNGPGIPPENQQLIFDDCFRMERDKAQDGYGIGLALCKRVVQAHYGQIWVDSELKQGSCFHFTLPVYRSLSGL